LKTEILSHLSGLDDDIKLMFKLSIPTVDNFYRELMDDEHVVRVVALSGGYSQSEANERLARNKGLIASFSRALSQGLHADQSDAEFDAMLKTSIKNIYDASIA
jgi:fructose-bisphosphate aldolase class I